MSICLYFTACVSLYTSRCEDIRDIRENGIVARKSSRYKRRARKSSRCDNGHIFCCSVLNSDRCPTVLFYGLVVLTQPPMLPGWGYESTNLRTYYVGWAGGKSKINLPRWLGSWWSGLGLAGSALVLLPLRVPRPDHRPTTAYSYFARHNLLPSLSNGAVI